MNLTDELSALVNEAHLASRASQKPRLYLGASGWGNECTRALAYEWHRTPKDADKEIPARVLRIFDMGHDTEERMASYLRMSGFDLLTHNADGSQIGFTDLDGQLAGHTDGIIRGGPLDLPYPLIWECKGLNSRSWSDTKIRGLQESKPTYYGQMQTYMGYLDVTNGGLFTALNRDTGEIYAEFIPYDLPHAQALSDKALAIAESGEPEEFGRLSRDPAFFKCAWCDYRRTCHNLNPTPLPAPTTQVPDWLTKATAGK